MRFGGNRSSASGKAAKLDEDGLEARRVAMVRDQIEARGVRDARVLAAMRETPRHRFLEPTHYASAYEDHPVTLAADQSTMSQPYIVARMTELLCPQPGDRVLEVGGGSGYQAAILAKLVCEVYTVERHSGLVQNARRVWEALGFDSIHGRTGDGRLGWPEAAPFQGIMVTAYASEPPPALLEQLAEGGRLVLPLGDSASQHLVRFTKEPGGGVLREKLLPCVFVPLVAVRGSAQDPE